MKYHKVVDKLANDSAKLKYSNYMQGSLSPKGLDLGLVAKTIRVCIPIKKSEKQIVKDLKTIEDFIYDQLGGK